MKTIMDQLTGNGFTAIHGDCVEAMKDIPSNSVDFSCYSPPFSSLYIYSDSVRDMGNCSGDAEFHKIYRFAVAEKLRVTKPGRLSAIHVKDLVYYSNASQNGDRGLRDFTGDCIRTHVEAGWSYHSRVTIWRCPVREMTKSKPDGLLFKNFRKDAARVRAGLPEYLVVFRKWAEGMDDTVPINHDGDPQYPLDWWQQAASPVWNHSGDRLPETDVLNAKVARADCDEKHLCPMPLNISDRAIRLWSNPGDVVLSPFMGIGSEGYAALRLGRKYVGIELKDSYFKQACKYLSQVSSTKQADLFEDVA
jgi:DNA modification methylase